MKKYIFTAFILLLICSFVCAKPKVKRMDSSEVIDLTGYWNDSDIRIVCESMIKDCVSSPRIAKFEERNGRAPVVIIGKIKNESSERIDTSIVAKKLQTAVLNSGVLEFVASSNERGEMREERLEQADHASMDSAKPIDDEQAADFMLTGSVKTDVQIMGKQSVRTYFVYLTLTDMATNRLLWQGENDEIKKFIKK